MQPFADDDTRPLAVPVSLQAVRTCRPAVTRITGPGIGETFSIPTRRKSGLVMGRSRSVDVVVDDSTVSREHLRIHVDSESVVHLTDLRSTNGTLVNGTIVESHPLQDGDKIQVGRSTVFRFSQNDRLDEDYVAHLYERSIRDGLTGLLNRRYLSEVLERDLALADRHSIPLALILIDVDHFKTVNDNFGHAGGDEALKGVGRLLQEMQRSESVLARYGGEEFAVLLRGVEPSGAEIFADRMRRAVDSARFEVGRGTVALTVSMGIAETTIDEVDSVDEMLKSADRYLYLSKRRGRNCITTARTNRA